MELCNDNHEEIVYEGRRFSHCPLCAANAIVKQQEEQIEELKDKVREAENGQ